MPDPIPESAHHGLADPVRPQPVEPVTPGRLPMLQLLAGGLAITLVLVFLTSRLEDHGARSDFSAQAVQRFTLLESSVERALDSLVAAGSFFDAAGQVSRAQFAALTRPLIARQPALQAIEWVPYVPGQHLDTLRAAVRAEGFPAFEVRELGPDGRLRPVLPRAEYFPVCFVEPLYGNERAFGFDLGSNPARFQALDAARRQGRMVASARITLVQEKGQQYGFLLFRPIYRGAPATASETSNGALSADPASLTGYVLGVFRIGQLVSQAPAGGDGHPLDLYVFDELGKPGETLLFPAGAAAQSPRDLATGIHTEQRLNVGDRSWSVVIRPAGGILRVDRTASVIVAVAGLMLTVLLAKLQEQNRSRTKAIELTVAARTADLRESEQRLILANQEAVQANRLKTMFLASMSHEFRTPMNAILGLLHVLGRTTLEPGQRDYVDKISSAARRLLRLIDDILDVSRIEAGKLSVEREPFRIEAVLRDVLVAIAPKLRDKRVEFVLDIDPSTPAHMIGDGMRLTQVLVNLADNAAKFTQEGTIELAVGWTPAGEQRVRLHVELRDTGQGMSEQDQRAVFLPFVQTENTHRRKHGGTGLGLAICRQLVTLMGGEIQVESQTGRGSRFWFDVPLDLGSPVALAAPQGEQAPVVLVIDPHAGAARALCRLIEAFGCQARAAGDEAAVREQLLQRHFDLVLVTRSFVMDRVLTGLPVAQQPARVVQLVAIGASLHGSDIAGALEKPLLPGLLAAVLFPVEREAAAAQAALAPVRLTGAFQPAPPAAATIRADAAAPASSAHVDQRSTLAARLRQLLLNGDPEAELVARGLERWAQNTPDAAAAAELRRLCADFDFREALAALELLCPRDSFQEI
ncbi:MAG: CHASE domain-containing protein [Pseudomonadota bacterium]|nr:CHASE domain-containing protein [Pseudomonadota bacterium]